MFRVLSRSGVLILFLTLIFTGYGYKHLTNLALAKKISLKAIRSIFLVLTLIAIAEFFIPLKITHVATPPKVYGYLGQTDLFKSPIVVYPYTKTNEAFFWLTTHKKALINPRFYQNKPSGFVSEDFTNLLTTTRGLENARNLGAKYLVYFYGDDGGKSADFFENASLLTKVADFEESDRGEKQIIVKAIDPIKLTFVRIVEAGSAKENSAILYKFR